jgi:diguanylate cyclase (GGDEF)-like protein
MSTLQRVLLAFGVIVAITAVQGLLMWVDLNSLADKSTLASTNPVASVNEARAAWSSYLNANSYLNNFLEMTKPEDSKTARTKFDDMTKALDGHLDRLSSAAISTNAAQDVKAVRADVSRWIDSAHILLCAAPAVAVPAPYTMAQKERNISDALDRLVQRSIDDAAAVRHDIETSAVVTGRIGILIVVLALVAGSTIAVLSSFSVTLPIRKIGDVLRELAHGNKAVEIPFTGRSDEVGDTARAAQSFRDSLVHMEELEVERREAEMKADQHIRFLAHHDALTALPNRAQFTERLADAVARQRRFGDSFGVFMLDLDGFKNVNDTLGHAGGDQLLREVAQRLKSALRETDVLARLGGDEFAIIQPGERSPKEAAAGLAARIMGAILAPFDVDGTAIIVGTSIGIALAPHNATEGADLLKMADVALYQAKSAGRNDYRFFDATMLQEINDRRQLEDELRTAISLGEFELHYQPLVDVKTRLPACFEALVRWRSPTRGLVMPHEFIPLAEETGLIEPLGAWILQQACVDAASWPAHVKVAVNLSPVQLTQPDLLQIVLCALVDASLPPERLELEITETALFKNDVDCVKLVRQLKQLGVSIALDDFGTGYSSLSYLTMIPFDKIKIDRSFTSRMTTRADCAAIVAAVLALGRSLCTETVAEGVETEQQFSILRDSGVTMAQGYLFGRPLPASRLYFTDLGVNELVASAA